MTYSRLLSRSRIHTLALLAAVMTAFNMSVVSIIAGLSLFSAGFILQIWSKAVLRRDKVLATRGPYALCRHPFYLANGLLDLGLIIMGGYVPALIAYPFLFLLAYLPAVRHEERILDGLFPKMHKAYIRHVTRFIPSSFRVFRHWRSPFSWRVLLGESQLSRSTRYASYPLVVLLAGRLWADPVTWSDPLTQGLASVIGGLLFLGFGFYGKLENGVKYRPLRLFTDWIGRHAIFLLIAGIPVAVFKLPWATPFLIALCIWQLVVGECIAIHARSEPERG